MAKRYTRKELRKEDEFVSFWHHVYDKASQSLMPILVGLGTATVVIIAASFWMKHAEAREADGSKALTHAVKLYEADLQTDDKDKSLQQMLQQEDEVPRFKTADERRKAALGELDEVISKYKGTGPAREAELVRAGVLLDAGQWDDAIKAYGDFLASTDSDNRLRFLAREGRGYAYEGKNQLDQALDEYRKLESEASDIYKDRAQFHEARILEKKGDKANAEKMYKAILEKNPTTTLRDEISNRLASLEAK